MIWQNAQHDLVEVLIKSRSLKAITVHIRIYSIFRDFRVRIELRYSMIQYDS